MKKEDLANMLYIAHKKMLLNKREVCNILGMSLTKMDDIINKKKFEEIPKFTKFGEKNKAVKFSICSVANFVFNLPH